MNLFTTFFFPRVPAAPIRPDDDLAALDEATLRRRLTDIESERRRLANKLRADQAPLVQQRDQLQAALAETDNKLRIEWRESEGPAVTPPRRRGFGHVVIQQIVPRALNGSGRLDFPPEGVNWQFEFTPRLDDA